MPARFLLTYLIIFCAFATWAQTPDSAILSKVEVGMKYLEGVEAKTSKITRKLQEESVKKLQKLKKLDMAVMAKMDKAKNLVEKDYMAEVEGKYNQLLNNVKGKTAFINKLNPGDYFPELDKLKTSLDFLDKEGRSMLSQGRGVQEKLQTSFSSVTALQDKMKQATAITEFLKERQQWLSKLDKFGAGKKLAKINKEIYYYQEQIKEYREALKDPKLIQAKAYVLIQKIPAFQNFFSKYSELAMLFPQPDNYGTASALQGLQTRAQIQQIIQTRTGTANGIAGTQAIQQGMGSAQSQMQQLKDKILHMGGNSSDFNMPDFKPNPNKTKTLKEKIEFGFNIQNSRSRSLFPVTTDFGFNLGYKFSRNGVAGIGASYKMGWGKSFKEIAITHEGIGLRAYIDWRIKGEIYLSGGYEQNYFSRFSSMDQLKDLSSWQQSGLIGLSKRYSIGKKWKGDVKLLWDFMSYQNIPKTQPFLFRFGYQIK
jgi:hypothetical protein